VKAYRDLAPRPDQLTVDSLTLGRPTYRSLVLGDGTTVEDPRDLVPAMDPNDPAVEHVNAFAKKSVVFDRLETAVLVGLGVSGAALVFSSSLVGSASTDARRTAINVGWGVAAASLCVAGVLHLLGFSALSQALDERDSVFRSYQRALQKRLMLDDDPSPQAP
jgi:hypothetical protein